MTKEELLAKLRGIKDKDSLALTALIHKYSGKQVRFKRTKIDCLESYTHKTRVGGYTQLDVEGTMVYLHRFVYFSLYPDTKTELSIRHSCDNPACCNPKHLKAGTHKSNMLDRDRKGRNVALSGLDHYESKFTREDIIAIRIACRAKSDKRVAEEFNVSRPTITSIRLGRRYGSVV